MKNIVLGLGMICLILSCQQVDQELQKELVASQNEVKELQETIAEMTTITPSKILTHTVFFNLKEGLGDDEIAAFEEGLKSLSKIEEAQHLKVGQSADTGDKRLISDYDYVLTMYFENMEDLQSYAKDSFHLQVKQQVGPMLAKAPIVYDAWLE